MEIKKILLVDDERHVRRIAEISLGTVKDWTIITAGSGAEGLNKVKEEHPDLILLDVRMPEMDGIAVLQKLRENPETATIPVILLTAGASEKDLEQQSSLFVLGTILKPYRPATLPDEIRALTANL